VSRTDTVLLWAL